MRPERIIVGEVRGAEALDMLQAMNTGHDGSLSTGHANSTRDMLSRLETMVLQGNAGDTATDFLRTGHCNPLVETQGQVPKNDGDYRNSGMQRRRIPVESAICFSGNTGQYAS